jgi:hypothetical protein
LPFNFRQSSANNGGNNQPAPLTPAQIVAQQKAAAQSAANAINEKNVAAFNQHYWKTAIDLFEQALQKWPENETIQKNLANARDGLAAQQHHEQEVRVAASIRDQIGQFADSLSATPVSGGLDFDGLRDGLVTKNTANPGLDFMVHRRH